VKLLSIAFIIALTAVAPAFAGERQINVAAKNFAFVPGTITLKVHQHARLRFIGTQGMHGIIIPEIGVNNVVNIGPSPSIVEVNPTRTGKFVAHCAVFCGSGHANMILKVNVIK